MKTSTDSTNKTTKKRSSVRHTRAIQRDRSKGPPVGPPDEHIAERLTELIHPATLAQLDYYRQLGLRDRILTLPVMVALVLSMIWRQQGNVSEVVRLLQTEGLLWAAPVPVSQQAVSERLRTVPADLFRRVLVALLPQMETRWQARQRPLPREIAWAQDRYSDILVHDGSTLDALLRKVGLLRDAETQPLAGRMSALLSLGSRLPRHIWFESDPQAHDQRWWPEIMSVLPAGCLLIFDLGYTNFMRFRQLTAMQVTFITRAKRNLAYTVERELFHTAQVHDTLIWIGTGDERQMVRLIEVLYRGAWYRYLTNELDSARLPTAYVAALYWQRWRIEDAYNIVKRLLGLAYFWVGSHALGAVSNCRCGPPGSSMQCSLTSLMRSLRRLTTPLLLSRWKWCIAACTTSRRPTTAAKRRMWSPILLPMLDCLVS